MFKKIIVLQIIAAIIIIGTYYTYLTHSKSDKYTYSLKEEYRLVRKLELKYKNKKIPKMLYTIINEKGNYSPKEAKNN